MSRPFTPDEDARLNELRLKYPGGRARGGLRDVARELGRARSSVQVRLAHLAAREEGESVRIGKLVYRPRQIVEGRRMTCELAPPERCHYCRRQVFRLHIPIADLGQRRTVDHVEPRHSPRRKGTRTVISCARCNALKGETPVEVFEFWLQRRDGRPIKSTEYRQFCHELMVKSLEILLEDDSDERTFTFDVRRPLAEVAAE